MNNTTCTGRVLRMVSIPILSYIDSYLIDEIMKEVQGGELSTKKCFLYFQGMLHRLKTTNKLVADTFVSQPHLLQKRIAINSLSLTLTHKSKAIAERRVY